MDKREVKRAFRAAMALEFAAVPATEDAVAYSFTQDFCRRMDALIAERKRGSWRLMRKRARRVLIAAILAVLLALLVACSPNLRMTIKGFTLSFLQRDIEYDLNTQLRDELAQLYRLDPPPDGFVLESQERLIANLWQVTYRNGQDKELVFTQSCTKYSSGTFVNTDSEMLSVRQLAGQEVLVWSPPNGFTLTWVQDGYMMRISCGGNIDDFSLEEIIAAVSVMEQAAQ